MGRPEVRDSKPELPVLPEIRALRPWYHDFSRLGLQTDFDEEAPGVVAALRRLGAEIGDRLAGARRLEKGGRLLSRATLLGAAPAHRRNQACKEEFLLPYLEDALAAESGSCRCLDLFCADGYYSCTMAALSDRAIVLGLDLDRDEIRRARAAALVLGLTNASFEVGDVLSFVAAQRDPFDLVLCAGGLYHLSDPPAFLGQLRPLCRRLVLQSVVTLETEDPGYFIAPAPGWKHGSRFTHDRLRGWLREGGWEVLREDRNELLGNRRLKDRGSSYFLCGGA